METYFTSDNHWGHKKILEYSKRPFANVDEMDEAMIERWNATVKPADKIFHIGDFALCDAKKACNIARRLNGQKFIVWGNHDKNNRKDKNFLGHWAWNKDLADITVGEQRIVLCHYALVTWNQSHRGAWDLFGHSHGSLRDNPNALQLDVGVDCWDYTPVSFEQIRERMKLKTFKPVDHHGSRGEI